jgi:uncharacterized protein YodC (DUF2158 family)
MFHKGDIVVLKGGGPRMTITGVPDEHSSGYFCQWFDESGSLNKARFPGESLKLIEK